MKETRHALAEYAAKVGVSRELLDGAMDAFVDATGFKPRVFGGDVNFTGEPRSIFDVHTIEMSNFMGIAKRKVEINPGITALWGPNNSGKSRVLRALLYALKGYSAVGASQHAKLISAGESKMFADVTFTKGHVRRGAAVRTIARGKEAGTTKLEEEVLVEVEGDQSDKPKEAQAILEHWAGVDLDFVLRSCFIRQGEMTKLLDEEPSARRAMVYKLMSLDACEEAAVRLRKWVSDLEADAAKAAGQSQELEAQLARLVSERRKVPVEQLKAKLKEIEAKPVPVSNKAKLEELKARLATLAKANEDTLARAKQKSQLTDKLNELRKDPTLAKSFADLGPRVDLARAQEARARAAVAQIAGRLAEVVERGKALRSLPATCDVCASIGKTCELTPELKEGKRQELLALHRSLSAEQKTADQEHASAKLELDVATDEQERVNKEKSQREFVEKQIAMLTETIATMGDAFEQHAKASQQYDIVNAEIRELSKQDAPEETDYRPVIAKELATAASLDEQIKAAQKRADQAKVPVPLDGPRALAKAFAKDGIPLMLARQHIGAINRLAAELCDGDQFAYSFGEELEIVIADPNGLAVEPKLVCGSARERGALVMAASLCRYMQNLAQLQVGTIWVDEIPFQDEANTQHVVSLLRALNKWYPKVVFGVCQFEPYQGKFDHEIALMPGAGERALAEVKAPEPVVKKYDEPAPKGHYTKMVEAAKAAEKEEDLPF